MQNNLVQTSFIYMQKWKTAIISDRRNIACPAVLYSLKNSKVFLHCCNRVTNFIYDNPFENPMRTRLKIRNYALGFAFTLPLQQNQCLR